ncbi:MAG: hypothetical protein WCP85_03950 [Mariniphaga sp.]
MKKPKLFLPFLKSKKNRVFFLIINIYLIIGMLTLLVTLIYLLINLDHSDVTIRNCIPGFVMGVSSGIIYFVGYQSLDSDGGSK